MNELFIADHIGLLRVVLSALITYVYVVIFIHLAGKRSTSQMNNFDWVVTVAIGSIVASTIILKDLPLFEGFLAVLALLTAQFFVTKLSAHYPTFSDIVHAEPTIIFYRGNFVEGALIKERLAQQEVMCAIRQCGIYRMQEVGAVVLESDAKLSVLPMKDMPSDTEDADTLKCISNYAQITQQLQKREH